MIKFIPASRRGAYFYVLVKKSTMVLINSARVYIEDDMIIFRVVGSHFLWKMIRRMTGILVEVGRHDLSITAVENLLHSPSDVPARFTAPPSGLFFEKAFYDRETFQTVIADKSVDPKTVKTVPFVNDSRQNKKCIVL